MDSTYKFSPVNNTIPDWAKSEQQNLANQQQVKDNALNTQINSAKLPGQISTNHTPQSSVTIPTTIPSDILTQNKTNIQVPPAPLASAQTKFKVGLTSATAPTAAPVTAPEVSPSDKLRQETIAAIQSYTNPTTGYGAKSLALQKETGLNDSTAKLNQFQAQDLALQTQLARFKEEQLYKNPQGLFGAGATQLVSEQERHINQARTDIAIQKLAVQGDIKTAQDLIKSSLDAEFEPLKDSIDYNKKALDMYNDDMTEEEKTKLTAQTKQLENKQKEVESFQKILDEAGLNKAPVETVNEAAKLFKSGDRTGAIAMLSQYSEKAKVESLTPYQKFQATQAISKEAAARTANSREIVRQVTIMNTAYDSAVKTGDKNAASAAIITSFNKILDPDSVVREAEFDRTAAGQSLLDSIQGRLSSLVQGGGSVTLDTLKEAKDLANQFLDGSKQAIQEENERAQAYAEQFGLNEDFVTTPGFKDSNKPTFTPEMENAFKSKGYTPEQIEAYKKSRGLSNVGSDTNRASRVATAIKDVESGGNYKAVGDAGTSKGAYQFQPASWKGWAKDYLGDSNAEMTPENQDKVAVARINDLIGQGYSDREIALIWNGGEPREKKGFNKKIGLAYDSGAYANKVLKKLNA